MLDKYNTASSSRGLHKIYSYTYLGESGRRVVVKIVGVQLRILALTHT